ncbi:MAG TPA: TlpA disulfide reductase family protein [Burkholderiaceae bacterium]|nr:TlpA disulfide reductase family protein [Burkholderiaceae bacterium]
MKRRAWIAVGGVGALAAASGAGLAWWRSVREEDSALWSLEFPTPDDTRLRLSEFRGRPLLINFWATWCAPCVREMPALDRFARDHEALGWSVVGLAIDNQAQVRDFLRKVPVTYAVAIAGFSGTQLARELGNPQGGLPFTVALDAKGRPAWRHLGETTYEQLAEAARASQP